MPPPVRGCVDGHSGNPEDGPGGHLLSIRGRGATTTGGPTPLGRSDPVLRFVRSRQRFVRWSQAPR